MKRYDIVEAAKILRIKPISVYIYARSGRLRAIEIGNGEYKFEAGTINRYISKRCPYRGRGHKLNKKERARNFNLLHGKGSCKKLMMRFRDRLSYQDIADEFDLSKERVRQLHDQFYKKPYKNNFDALLGEEHALTEISI